MAKSLEEHYGYLSDRVKVRQYQAMIERLVSPKHVVLDLGCGSVLLGLMALRAGARKVYFMDEGIKIEVARRTVGEAGFAGKAGFFRANSFELKLPEALDVVLCDRIGYFGFDYGTLALLADARERFPKPGGVILPCEIELQLAETESEACRQFVGEWWDGSVPDEYGWLAANAANTKHAPQLEAKDLLADRATLSTVRTGAEAAPYLYWNAEFRCSQDGTLDGLAGWFDCCLFDDIRMTNSPVAEECLARPQAFLPLESLLTVNEGEPVRVMVMVRHLDNLIAWIVELPDSGYQFAHTTFNNLLLDSEGLIRARPDRAAKLNDRGLARHVVLSYCDGRRSVAEVEALEQREHAQLFPSAQATSSFVGHMLSWDTSE